MNKELITILGIESSCDDTAAAILQDGKILANIVANQDVHKSYGGVVPELASRAHQQNIVPVVSEALKMANISKQQLSAIAFTRGPGLLGSLLVGSSFAKAFSLGLDIPVIEVNHMQAHVLSHFIEDRTNETKSQITNKSEILNLPVGRQGPKFPFLCLTVSGGHTQIVLVKDHLDMEIIGQTIDDAAGECFDKSAKVIGLPYPGGPLIDELALNGDPDAFKFPHPNVPDLNYSFSGLKTAFLYFIRDKVKENPNFIKENKADICASIQATIITVLMKKLKKAAGKTGITEIAIAGGVAANSGLRNALANAQKELGWNIYIPEFEYCTDNAAMIAITGYYKFQKGIFADQSVSAVARYPV